MLGKHWENGNTLKTSCSKAFEAYILQHINCVLCCFYKLTKVLENPKYTSFQRYF